MINETDSNRVLIILFLILNPILIIEKNMNPTLIPLTQVFPIKIGLGDRADSDSIVIPNSNLIANALSK